MACPFEHANLLVIIYLRVVIVSCNLGLDIFSTELVCCLNANLRGILVLQCMLVHMEVIHIVARGLALNYADMVTNRPPILTRVFRYILAKYRLVIIRVVVLILLLFESVDDYQSVI